MLSRDSQGPRAVTNALHRLAASYEEQCETARKEVALATTQLRDYEARHGLPFTHAAYLDELTLLRDRLKTALSETPAEGEPSAGELAEQISTLKASHALEAAPTRMKVKPRMELIPNKAEKHEAKPDDENPGTQGEDDSPSTSFRTQVRFRGYQHR